MLERVANYLNKALLHASRILSSVGMVTMAVLVLVIVVGVLTRRFFDLPIRGLRDLTTLGFSIIVFLPMALCAFNNRHVTMSVFTERFPKLLRTIIESIILFVTTATLGLLTWQLFTLALRLQTAGQTTKILEIPFYPFLYLATLGILLMTLVFLAKLVVSAYSLVRRR